MCATPVLFYGWRENEKGVVRRAEKVKRCHRAKWKTAHEGVGAPGTLAQASVGAVSRLSFRLMDTHEHQPVGIWIHLRVLGDVPI